MADPPPFTQTGKRLEIHTVLNDGTPLINALLLIWVKGSEEVSQPYTYQVKMWRLVNNTRPPIPPADMINTQVSIHINFKQTLQGQSDPRQCRAGNTDACPAVRRLRDIQ